MGIPAPPWAKVRVGPKRGQLERVLVRPKVEPHRDWSSLAVLLPQAGALPQPVALLGSLAALLGSLAVGNLAALLGSPAAGQGRTVAECQAGRARRSRLAGSADVAAGGRPIAQRAEQVVELGPSSAARAAAGLLGRPKRADPMRVGASRAVPVPPSGVPHMLHRILLRRRSCSRNGRIRSSNPPQSFAAIPCHHCLPPFLATTLCGRLQCRSELNARAASASIPFCPPDEIAFHQCKHGREWQKPPAAVFIPLRSTDCGPGISCLLCP